MLKVELFVSVFPYIVAKVFDRSVLDVGLRTVAASVEFFAEENIDFIDQESLRQQVGWLAHFVIDSLAEEEVLNNISDLHSFVYHLFAELVESAVLNLFNNA